MVRLLTEITVKLPTHFPHPPAEADFFKFLCLPGFADDCAKVGSDLNELCGLIALHLAFDEKFREGAGDVQRFEVAEYATSICLVYFQDHWTVLLLGIGEIAEFGVEMDDLVERARKWCSFNNY